MKVHQPYSSLKFFSHLVLLASLVSCASHNTGVVRDLASTQTAKAISALNEYAALRLEEEGFRDKYSVALMEGESCFFEAGWGLDDREIKPSDREKFQKIINEVIIFLKRYDSKLSSDTARVFYGVQSVLLCNHRQLGRSVGRDEGVSFFLNDSELQIGIPYGILRWKVPTSLEIEKAYVGGEAFASNFPDHALKAKVLWNFLNPVGPVRNLLRNSFKTQIAQDTASINRMARHQESAHSDSSNLQTILASDVKSPVWNKTAYEWFASLSFEDKMKFYELWKSTLTRSDIHEELNKSFVLKVQDARSRVLRESIVDQEGAPASFSLINIGGFYKFVDLKLDKGVNVADEDLINVNAQIEIGAFDHLVQVNDDMITTNTKQRGSVNVSSRVEVDVLAAIRVNNSKSLLLKAAFEQAAQDF